VAAATNSYSTRFNFRYAPVVPVGATPAFFASGSSVTLVMAFGLIPNPLTDVYESAWGVPQTANVTVNATLSDIPMPPP
jgi:hypothetical protein